MTEVKTFSPLQQDIFTILDNSKEDMLTFWEDLVNHESGSFYKVGLDKTRDFLVETLTDLGATINVYNYENAGDMIVADLNRTEQNAKNAPIIFSGHYDTVFKEGTVAERPFKIIDGKAYGPGVLDMKAGVTMLIFVAKTLLKAHYSNHPLRIVLLGDEEIGHRTSTAAEDLSEAVKGACAAFNFESGYEDDGFVTGRKGGGMATFTVHGIGAHAGNEPEKGRSAILELAHKIIDVQALNNFETGLTFNCGVIKGGTVMNAVPEMAEVTIDIRVKNLPQLKEAEESLRKIAEHAYLDGTKTEMTFKRLMYPMETTEGVKQLFSLLEDSAKEISFGPIYGKYVGGGADSSYEVKAGVPTICAVGIAGGKNHSVDEFAVVDTMFSRAKLVANTVLKIK